MSPIFFFWAGVSDASDCLKSDAICPRATAGSVWVAATASIFFSRTWPCATSDSLAPSALPISADCSAMMRSPGTPVPASSTRNATSGALAATRGAIRPPSLWPISPTFLASTRGWAFR